MWDGKVVPAHGYFTRQREYSRTTTSEILFFDTGDLTVKLGKCIFIYSLKITNYT
jgi:hypothetical protein